MPHKTQNIRVKYKNNTKYGESQLEILISKELDCVSWASVGGVIQQIINSTEFELIKTIHVNLQDCLSASPFPLISMLLLLKKIKEEYGKKIVIDLPVQHKEFEKLKQQFLFFLASQGFLKEMLKSGFIVKSRYKIDETALEEYLSYNCEQEYSSILPFNIYELEQKNEKEKIVKEIDSLLSLSLKNNMFPQAYDFLSMQVYNTISELIENVYNHAYTSKETKRFGVYIRKRTGVIQDNYDTEKINSLKSALKTEEEKSPALDNSILEKNNYVLEIFFIDIGMGLSGSLNSFYTNYRNKHYNYPIKELFVEILKNGLRKEQRENTTPYGGLHFICRLLKETSGNIWCNEGKEWLTLDTNKIVESNDKSSIFGVSKIVTNDNELYCSGLSLCLRIPFDETSKISNNIVSKWNGTPTKHPVYEEYKYNKDYQNMSIKNVICIDDNYKKKWYLNGSPKNWTEDISLIPKMDEYSVIWFPKSNLTKNDIYKSLKNVFKFFESPQIPAFQPNFSINETRIIISDIENSDIISYYYVLKDFFMPPCNSFIREIILITKQWEVVWFSNDNNVLKFDAEKATKFVTSTNHNNIYSSLVSYAIFIRKYYSYLFWDKTKKYSKEKLFIKGDIEWGKGKYIQGYLDFEKVIVNEELYSLLELAIKRTLGYFYSTNIRYNSTDCISRRICQNINYNLSSEKAKHFINIFTICVTGYTKKAYNNYSDILEGDSLLNIAFFANCPQQEYTNTNFLDVSFLFVWPDSNFFENFPETSKKFFRVGKTSCVCEDKTINRIDVETAYQNSASNKIEMYREFQSNHPIFLKYGHYCTDSHHYLIGLDLLSYLRNGYFKKTGGFVFLLWKLYMYLNQDPNNQFEDIQDIEWRKILQCVNYNHTETGDIVVYHSNTFTDYFISKIKEILPAEYTKKIIPVIFFESSSIGTPLSISPTTTTNIAQALQNTVSKNILYLDSSFSTGRSMAEVENILFNIGCSNVNFLCVVDMRRLKSYDKKLESYWKLNIPRLNDSSNCIICDSIKELKSFKHLVAQKICTRIDEWLEQWQVMNITNSFQFHGIEKVIVDNVHINDVNVYDANTLNVYISEQLSETYDKHTTYNFLKNKTNLPLNIRIQLICTQLCLFGNQNSRQLQLSLLHELIDSMARVNNPNSYTSLGGMVLLSQTASTIYDLLNRILYENTNIRIQTTKNLLLNSTNTDLIISFCFFVKKSRQIEILLNDFKSKNSNEKFNLIEAINEYILPEKRLKLISREFIGLLINEQGTDHGTNINKFKNETIIGFEGMKNKSSAAKNDIIHLNTLVNQMPVSLFNKRVSVEKEAFQENNDTILQIEQFIEQETTQFATQTKNNPNSTYKMSPELTQALQKCKNFYMKFAKGYFIHSQELLGYLKELIELEAHKKNKKINISMHNNLHDGHQKKWYYWNQSIEKEFIYLIDNLKHCDKILSKDDDIFMDVKINYDDNYITLSTVSWARLTASGVKEKFLEKNRLTKEQALAFDVVFDFSNEPIEEEGYKLLKSQMRIPSCFQSLKGGFYNE